MRGEIYLFSTGRKKTHKNMFPSVVLLRFVACLFFAQTAVHTRNKSRDTSKYTGITARPKKIVRIQGLTTALGKTFVSKRGSASGVRALGPRQQEHEATPRAVSKSPRQCQHPLRKFPFAKYRVERALHAEA